MTYLIAVVILLGILIFVHEMGHFLLGKYFNVKVEVFSFGFGPKIFRKKWGETEYCVSVVPFGGYVKFFGYDPSKKVPDHLKERSFFFVSPVKRFLIVAAGPVSNLILAFFIFAFIAIIGEPLISSYIADVSPDSPAWEAGFRPGDRITSLNEQPVHTFEEIFEIIRESEIKPMSATVFRGGIEETIQFTPQITDSVNYYGEPVKIPSLPGLS